MWQSRVMDKGGTVWNAGSQWGMQKKGPKTGCWTCGGAHYFGSCPIVWILVKEGVERREGEDLKGGRCTDQGWREWNQKEEEASSSTGSSRWTTIRREEGQGPYAASKSQGKPRAWLKARCHKEEDEDTSSEQERSRKRWHHQGFQRQGGDL